VAWIERPSRRLFFSAGGFRVSRPHPGHVLKTIKHPAGVLDLAKLGRKHAPEQVIGFVLLERNHQLRDQRGQRRRYWPPFAPWIQ
jgi:hypothetical protein